MLFQSVEFAIFLIVTFSAFWAISDRRNPRTLLLLLASYVFYSFSEIPYVGLLVYSSVLDWNCGNRIHAATDQRTKRRWLTLSLVGNLGVLGYFKYTDWGIESLNLLFDRLGVETSLETLNLIIPVGISFYTFQTLSYTLDIYRGQLKPARNLLDFAMFVAFFPQLVAGPIVRAADFLPQLELRPRLDRERFMNGLWRIANGLVKKVVLADQIGAYLVDPVYEAPDAYGPLFHAAAILGFLFQIYYDFSGYSDLAIGVGRLFGFDLPENFNGPFKSRSVSEFWRRWHMTLSFWVRDYVFYPLMGKRGIRSRVRLSVSIMTTMVVIGLWHGASVLWLLYGVLQGAVMIVEQNVTLKRRRNHKTPTWLAGLQWLATFVFIALVSGFCIRARTWDQALSLVSVFGEGGSLSHWAWISLAVGMTIHFLPKRFVEGTRRLMLALPIPLAGILLGALTAWVAYLTIGATPFIYFQF